MAAKKSVRVENSAADVPVEDEAVQVRPGLYPEGTELFEWTPESGGDPIVLPKATAVYKKGEIFRFFFQLSKRKGNQYEQVMFMIDSAGVPLSVQERVFDLPDGEVMRLVSAWVGEVRLSPGES